MAATARKKAVGTSAKAKARKVAESAGEDHSIEELTEMADGRRKYPANMSRKDKRALRKLRKQKALGVDTSHAEALIGGKEDKRSDDEVLEDIQRRFRVLRRFAKAVKNGMIRFLIAPGATGIGKSYNIDEEMEVPGTVFTRVSGTISDIELYKLAYQYRFKGNVIVVDDGDKIFKNESTINLLKHMTDTRPHRVLTWRTNSEFLFTEATKTAAAEEVPKEFEYEGSIIVLSNKDFQAEIDAQRGKNWEHMEALIGRGYYLDLRVHNRRAISLWVNYIATKGKMLEKEGINEEQAKIILGWLDSNKNKLREYSLRTLKKLATLVKNANGWTPEVVEEAETTLLR